MISPELLFIEDFEELQRPLFRSGNSSSPNFSQNRALKDVSVYEKNGISYVRANGNGFSTFDYITSGMKRQGKNVWKIKQRVLIPQGLKIVFDRSPNKKGHFMIAPEQDMPLMKYLGLLQELGSDVNKCVKLTPQEIQNA
ncbi:hypothetical protein NDQ71_24290 (plasmid) [Pseudoalteromonas sp. KG3]|jgi:hypothetical protein|uniref:Tse2 ADP-ribosyltransferase toxin domain-containing protein n=1 Tax=Pseudoalteromonas arctica TaxID=394751 RepID=A0A7Y0DWA1_9GAMM|nr:MULTISPECIES: hypothetical protein [Pseudoalteromonas]NMM42763.1 hypothetical protein [Pseudoalteromonas arctica]WKD26481.1 hypothetical protein NDQ71_24290 [Pseudoalteromonas sp. KG3]